MHLPPKAAPWGSLMKKEHTGKRTHLSNLRGLGDYTHTYFHASPRPTCTPAWAVVGQTWCCILTAHPPLPPPPPTTHTPPLPTACPFSTLHLSDNRHAAAATLRTLSFWACHTEAVLAGPRCTQETSLETVTVVGGHRPAPPSCVWTAPLLDAQHKDTYPLRGSWARGLKMRRLVSLLFLLWLPKKRKSYRRAVTSEQGGGGCRGRRATFGRRQQKDRLCGKMAPPTSSARARGSAGTTALPHTTIYCPSAYDRQHRAATHPPTHCAHFCRRTA